MTTDRDEENLRPSIVRYSLETTSVGRFSAPSDPGLPSLAALAAVAEQHRGPDLGVEDDVVLAHEVVGLRVRRLPPGPPGVRVAGAPRPLDRRRQVADDRVEPDVDPLVRPVPPAVQRDRHAPVEVTGDGPRLQVAEQVQRELQHVGPPLAALALQPGPEHVGEGGQVEEELLGLHEDRRLAVDLRARVDQVGGVELIAAVVALVTARRRRTRRSGRCPRRSGRAASGRSTARSRPSWCAAKM